jgi:hypothetical protein
MPCVFNPSETAVFRGLSRLEPLPCAKTTSARAPAGTHKIPGSASGDIAVRTLVRLEGRSACIGLDANPLISDVHRTPLMIMN